jgi:hypothetical protein
MPSFWLKINHYLIYCFRFDKVIVRAGLELSTSLSRGESSTKISITPTFVPRQLWHYSGGGIISLKGGFEETSSFDSLTLFFPDFWRILPQSVVSHQFSTIRKIIWNFLCEHFGLASWYLLISSFCLISKITHLDFGGLMRDNCLLLLTDSSSPLLDGNKPFRYPSCACPTCRLSLLGYRSIGI